MPVASLRRRTKALTIVPLALLSGAWTVNLVSSATAGAATTGQHHTLPDGTAVPKTAIQAPASIPQSGQVAPAVPDGSANAVVAGATAGGIPSVALAAYQNAARIINSADKSCNIPWALIGAIGRVESDNGQFDGNHLTGKGIDDPGIFGPVLDGKHGTAMIADTDGGRLDGNTQFDRAVGPMQFLPSTWKVVQVDADNDGRRNPQDINDASLAAAVYLCSGSENLATRSGEQSAVFRYNHSQQYVDLVLRIMEAYEAGDYTSVPSGSFGGTLFSPDYASAISHQRHGGGKTGGKTKGGGSKSGGGTTTGGGGTTGGGSGTTGGGGGTTGGGGSQSNPLSGITSGIQGALSDAPTVITQPVEQVLSAAAALTLCDQQIDAIPGGSVIVKVAAPLCQTEVTGKTNDQALAMIPDTLSALKKWLGL